MKQTKKEVIDWYEVFVKLGLDKTILDFKNPSEQIEHKK
jgi:hypothetical protein